MATRPSVIIFVATTLGVLFARGQVRAGDDDAKLMAGKWRVVSAKHNEGDYLKDKIEKMVVVIDKNTIRVSIEDTKSAQAAEFTLDPKKEPKHIDFTKATLDSEWPGDRYDKLFQSWRLSDDLADVIPADTKVQGIYKLEGDSLTLCWRTTKVSPTKDVRPSEFKSFVYHQEFLFVLERVHPAVFEPLQATPEERDQLTNSRAWKFRYRTTQPQKTLRLSYFHFTRDAAGQFQKRYLTGSSTSSGTVGDDGKINDVLILLSTDNDNVQFSNTLSRPKGGSVGGSGQFNVHAKGLAFVGGGDGGSPTRIGEHFILLARIKDGKAPKRLDEISEFISVVVEVE